MDWSEIGWQAQSRGFTLSVYPDAKQGFMWVLAMNVPYTDGVCVARGYAPTLDQAKDDAVMAMPTPTEPRR